MSYKHESIPFHKKVEHSTQYSDAKLIIGDELFSKLETRLADTSITRNQAIDDMADHKEVRDVFISMNQNKLPVVRAMGLAILMRHNATKGRTFEIDPNLNFMLDKTDIGSKAPSSAFKLPFPSICIHFPSNEIEIGYFKLTEPCILNTVYINELTDDKGADRIAREKLGITHDFKTYEVVFVGQSGEERFNFLHSRIVMPESWADSPLEDTIKRQLEVYAEQEGDNIDDSSGFKFNMAKLTNHLVKCLLIINSQEVILEEDNEEDAVSTRVEAVKKVHKKEKLKKRLAKVYNKIYVKYGDTDDHSSRGNSNGTATIRGHWRRGHFRMQRYGHGRTKHRTIWLKPAWVKGRNTTEEAPDKTYRVRT